LAADAIKRLEMYPYFDVAHYMLIAEFMAVQDDTYPGIVIEIVDI